MPSLPIIGTTLLLLFQCLELPAATNGSPLRVLSFNVLAGGAAAAEVGSTSPLYNRPRQTNIADVILRTGADIVCVNEPPGSSDPILPLLQASDPNWRRRGGSDGRINIHLYARFLIEPDPLQPANPTVHRVRVSPTQSVFVHTIHWWPAGGYGPDVVQKCVRADDVRGLATQVLAQVSIPGTYRRTLDAVKSHLESGEPVVILGDFNEPSHLDWTDDYAARGADRWVGNPSGRPLRPAIAWAGSRALMGAGLRDAYRTVFPDPVAKPGNTWTPPYATGTPGRKPWEDQVLDRIDMIYYGGGLEVVSAAVVGESAETSDLVIAGPWPSDHRAVLAVFEWPASATHKERIE